MSPLVAIASYVPLYYVPTNLALILSIPCLALPRPSQRNYQLKRSRTENDDAVEVRRETKRIVRRSLGGLTTAGGGAGSGAGAGAGN